jgi:hypothetical protein
MRRNVSGMDDAFNQQFRSYPEIESRQCRRERKSRFHAVSSAAALAGVSEDGHLNVTPSKDKFELIKGQSTS